MTLSAWKRVATPRRDLKSVRILPPRQIVVGFSHKQLMGDKSGSVNWDGNSIQIRDSGINGAGLEKRIAG
jgi:hypothetical protein